MYFAHGWPDILHLPLSIGEQIVGIEKNLFKHLLLVISNIHLYVWYQGQSTILLGSTNTPGSQNYIQGIWIPSNNESNNDSICVLDDIGQRYFFDITEQQLNYQYQTKNTNNNIKFLKTHSISINHVKTIPPPSNLSKPTFLCTVESLIISGTNDGKLLIEDNQEFYSIHNQLLNYETFREYSTSTKIAKERLYVNKIIYENGLLGIIFNCGYAAIIPIYPNLTECQQTEVFSNISNLSNSEKGYWLPFNNCTCMAISNHNELIAIGHSNGEISLFSKDILQRLHFSKSLQNKLCKILSLKNWDINPIQISGKISSLSWSPDGNILAVGWSERGFGIWSSSGCKLMCSILTEYQNKELEIYNENNKQEKIEELFSKGIQCMNWGCEGFCIFLSSNQYQSPIYKINFLQCISLKKPSLNYSKDIILLGKDKIYFLCKKTYLLSNIQIPNEYLQFNWPIKHISINRKGNCIAIVGKNNFLIYNTKNQYWLTYNHIKQQKQINCIYTSWYLEFILILNKIEEEEEEENNFIYEFLIFQQNSNEIVLHNQFILPTTSHPYKIDCNDSNIIILMEDMFIYNYKIKYKQNLNLLKMKLKYQTFITSEININSFLLLNNKLSKTLNTKLLIHDFNSNLYLLFPEEDKKYIISSNIEQFWYCNYKGSSNSNSNHLKFNEILITSTKENKFEFFLPFENDNFIQIHSEISNSLEFYNDIFPIGFSDKNGTIIGLSQIQSFSNASTYPKYDILIHNQSFFHILLFHFLLLDNHPLVLNLAEKYSFLSNFEYSLELLLHECLENKEFYSKIKLEKIIKFLLHFPNFPKIIVRCARKTDFSYWEKLFNEAGNPIELFRLCLAQGFFDCAASFLRIIQVFNGISNAIDASYILLELILENNQIDLIYDILNYLQILYFDNHMEIKKITPKEQNLIQSYFIRLLSKFNIKQFYYVYHKISKFFSIKKFLNNNVNELMIHNYNFALNFIHESYNFPFPCNFNESLLNNNIIISKYDDQYFLTSDDQNLLESNHNSWSFSISIVREFEFLLIEMYNSNNFDWCVILSCVLMNASLLLHILQIYEPAIDKLKVLSSHSS